MGPGDVVAFERVAERLARGTAERLVGRTGAGSPTGEETLDCLSDPQDRECAAQLIARIGRLLYRRPLTPEEQQEYLDIHALGAQGSATEAVELALYAMLLSPRFLYRVEDGGPPVPGAPDLYALTSYEQVTRLSFALLGTGPSEDLLDRAATADALSPGALQELAVGMAGDASRAPLLRFYDEWLGLLDVPDLPYPPGFVEPYYVEGLYDDMLAEVRAFLERITLDRAGSLRDLLTEPEAELRSPGLAHMYGLTMADAGPYGIRRIEDGTRAGLLTLPGLLRGAGEFPSPVLRGVALLRTFLCQPVPTPAPGSLPSGALAVPLPDPTLTNRQRWDKKTGIAPCTSCHEAVNALGFAFEHYDPLGRYRALESPLGVLWGSDQQMLPIDARSEVPLDGTLVPVDGVVELSEALAASPQVHRCVASWWFRQVLGRQPEADDDTVLQTLADRLADGPMVEALRAIVSTAAFTYRRVPR